MERGPVDVRERAALLGTSAVVGTVLLLHEPGRIVPETKLDVLLDPAGMAARALGAWDPSAAFGRVQNQAVGYLFPMGAWSALGKAIGLPPWIVQRLWLWAIVALSLWGAHRVARAVGIATAGGRVVAAAAYALAPATLTISFFQSAGQLPYALVPHVLAELMSAREGASPRRVAARSTLWLVAMGGVNGASAIAVLPAVAVWFWTRSPGPTRRRLLGWWSAGAVLATLWWTIPLLVTVRYGVRFTDFTESAATTTITESATEVLRGTGNWLSYVDSAGGAWLPGSWAMVSAPLAIVATIGLAAAGLGGLARRDAPERTWMVACLLVGTFAMGVGWAGGGGGPFASAAQDLLDGPLAPLRNVHKFAAVVRLPLALGLGHLVAVAAPAAAGLVERWAGRRPGRASGARVRVLRARPALVAPVLAAGLVLAAVAPAVDAGLTAPGSFEDVPVAWRQAAAWVDAHDDGGRTLVLPGSAFGEYDWGRPLDEPLSSLLASDWAVRDLVPLGGNGSTRLLDGIDRALMTDALPEGFVPTLRRGGVQFVLVRNDLDLRRTGGPAPATMRRLLSEVEGLELAASFGPVLTATGGDGRRAPVPGEGFGGAASEAIRQIDVYAVGDAVPRVAAYPAADAIVLGGGPEGLLGVPEALTDGRAVVLAVDDPGDLVDPIRVATDSARRRDVEVNAVRDGETATLTAGEASPRTGEAPFDRWPGEEPVGLTVAEVEGAAAIVEHGSEGQLVRPEGQAAAVFDGNLDTSWEPSGEGAWIEVRFEQPTAVGAIEVDLPRADGRRVLAVDVTVGERTTRAVVDAEGRAEVPSAQAGTNDPLEPVSSVRIEVAEVGGTPDLGALGIAEVRIDGARIARPLVVAPAGTPIDGEPEAVGADALVLVRDRRDRLDRARRDEDGSFERLVDWGGGQASVSGTATYGDSPFPERIISDLAPDGATVRASASSTYRRHPSADAAWVLDGDPATAWVSDLEAGIPELTLSWDGPVLVDSLVIDVLGSGVDPVGRVEVEAGGVVTDATLDASGRVQLREAVTTDELTIRFPQPEGGSDVARIVGVADVDVPALLGRTAAVPDRDAELELRCGSGPDVRIDGHPLSTQVHGTVGDLVDGRALRWESCQAVALEPGEHRIFGDQGQLFVASMVVVPIDGVPEVGAAGAVGAARTVRVERWGADHRTLEVSAGEATVLATTENPNDGWEATLDGERLASQRVDGWRQGWMVPAGAAGTVELRYRPASTQRAGMALAVVALLVLVGAAWWGGRRRGDASVGALDPTTTLDPLVRPRPLDRRVGGVLAASTVAVGVGLAGFGAALVAPLALVAPIRRRLPVVASLTALAAGSVALTDAGAAPGAGNGTFSALAQWLATAAVVAAATSAWASAFVDARRIDVESPRIDGESPGQPGGG